MVTEDGWSRTASSTCPWACAASLIEATNYMSARLVGRTLGEARSGVLTELEQHRAELDALTSRVVEAGLATWPARRRAVPSSSAASPPARRGHRTLRSRAHPRALRRARDQGGDVRLLEPPISQVSIFIAPEQLSARPLLVIIAPLSQQPRADLAPSLIGPTRINYARIIPMSTTPQ